MRRKMRMIAACMLLVGLWVWAAALPQAQATNALKTRTDAAIVFRNAAQTTPNTTVTMTLSNIPPNTGRISAQQNQGGGAVWATEFLGFCQVQLTGTLTVGEEIELYAAPGDGTNVAGQLGTVDAAIATANEGRLLSLLPIATLQVNQTTGDTPMHVAFLASIPFQRWSLVLWNRTTNNTRNLVSATWCTFTPLYLEIQD